MWQLFGQLDILFMLDSLFGIGWHQFTLVVLVGLGVALEITEDSWELFHVAFHQAYGCRWVRPPFRRPPAVARHLEEGGKRGTKCRGKRGREKGDKNSLKNLHPTSLFLLSNLRLSPMLIFSLSLALHQLMVMYLTNRTSIVHAINSARVSIYTHCNNDEWCSGVEGRLI